MAGPAVEVPEAPGKWYYPLLGLLFASLVIAAAVWSAISQIEDGDKASEDHAGEVDEHDGDADDHGEEDDTHE